MQSIPKNSTKFVSTLGSKQTALQRLLIFGIFCICFRSIRQNIHFFTSPCWSISNKWSPLIALLLGRNIKCLPCEASLEKRWGIRVGAGLNYISIIWLHSTVRRWLLRSQYSKYEIVHWRVKLYFLQRCIYIGTLQLSPSSSAVLAWVLCGVLCCTLLL